MSNKASWKKLPEEVRRKAILCAAKRCFTQKGFSDTSVNDIAAAAELTKGGIYFHFDSKEDIRLALINEFSTQVLAELDELLSSNKNAISQLRDILTFLLNSMGEEDGLLLTIAESVSRHKAGVAEIKQYYQNLCEKLAIVITKGQGDGVFAKEIDLELTIEIILTSLSGLALHREMDRAGINLCGQKNQVIDYLVNLVRKN